MQDSRLHTTTLGQKFWIVDPKTQDGSKILGEESTEIGKSRVPHLTAVQICEHDPCEILHVQCWSFNTRRWDLGVSHSQTSEYHMFKLENPKKTKTKSKDTLLRAIPWCPPRHSSWHSIYIYIYIYIHNIYIYLDTIYIYIYLSLCCDMLPGSPAFSLTYIFWHSDINSDILFGAPQWAGELAIGWLCRGG